MPIKIPRRQRTADPRIDVQASDVGAPVEAGILRGTAKVQRGLQDFSRGAQELAQGIGDYRARVQEKKDDVTSLEAQNNISVELT